MRHRTTTSMNSPVVSRHRFAGSHRRVAATSLAARLGVVVAACAAALALSSTTAGAAASSPLVSVATSDSGGGSVNAGTQLTVQFSETPVLASAYSLTLADGSHLGTLSTADGNLTAAVNGSSITFTATGAPAGGSLSLGGPLEIIGSTGVSDGAGSPWDLVASGQVNKRSVLAPGDQVVVTFDEPVTVNSGAFSLTLQEGSGSATINQSDANASASGDTVTYDVTGNPSGSVATDGPTVSGFTGVTATPTVQVGDTLTATFNAVVTAGLAPYSLTLADASGDAGTLSSSDGGLGTPVVTPGPGVGQTTVAYSVDAAPTLSAGTQLFTTRLQATADSGLVGASTPFSLTTTGPGPSAPSVTTASVNIGIGTVCATVGVTRVFGGSNCNIGFQNAGPTTPDVFDVIPLPTADLPGPPNDAAPEVITNCQAGSTDIVYDVNSGAELGANACGNNPPGEVSIGNTNSSTLDYIPTPNLASFEEAGVVETIPGSTYVSATAVPPQISSVTFNSSYTQATFSYYGAVTCQASSGDFQTYSQFTYETPYTDLDRNPDANGSGLVYPTGISCPSGSGSTSITVTYPNPIPFNSGVRFKFEGYGPGHFIIGAPGSAFANQREASQSFYAGPTATITSFTPQVTTLATSAGGAVNVSFNATDALSCSIRAVSTPASAAALGLPAASCTGGAPGTSTGGGTITVPANTSTTSNVVYTVSLTANGVAGTPPANAEITITVPAAPAPPVATSTGTSLSSGGGTTPSTPPIVKVGAPLMYRLGSLVKSHLGTATFHFSASGEVSRFECSLVRKPTRKGAHQPKPNYASARRSRPSST